MACERHLHTCQYVTVARMHSDDTREHPHHHTHAGPRIINNNVCVSKQKRETRREGSGSVIKEKRVTTRRQVWAHIYKRKERKERQRKIYEQAHHHHLRPHAHASCPSTSTGLHWRVHCSMQGRGWGQERRLGVRPCRQTRTAPPRTQTLGWLCRCWCPYLPTPWRGRLHCPCRSQLGRSLP